MSNSSIYIRGLRHADHTVFCVADGQKYYYDPQFSRRMPYSSGQQVKRSVMDSLVGMLGDQRAPITFNYEVKKDKKGPGEVLENKEPWSPCDPSYPDQLVGGWMRARTGAITLKRRSPLSISAMRPLHPLLANMSTENLTFDRSEHPERHPVRVLDASGNEMSDEAINEWLHSNERTLPRRHWIPDNARASGLFVFDVAVDLSRLFTVSANTQDPELDRDKITELKDAGWAEHGDALLAPPEMRERVMPALAHALVNWRVTSNQARTFSPQPTLTLAVSDNANRIANAIRADLDPESPLDKPKAIPVVDQNIDNVEFFIAPAVNGFVRGLVGDGNAMDRAEAYLLEQLQAYDYGA